MWLLEEFRIEPQTNAIKSPATILGTVPVLLSSREVHRTAIVEKRRLLARGTHVGPGAELVGDVWADEGAFIDSNAVLYGPVKIGKGTYVGPNSILGYPAANELKQLIQTRKIKEKKVTTIGDDCILRTGTILYAGVKVGDTVAFGHNVTVRENVTIGSQTKVGTNVVVDGSSRIGAHVSVQTGVYICTYSTIEDSVFLGPCCVFTNDRYVAQKSFKLVGPTVKRGASIGANALLFPGITVGEGAVVGSQAMVNVDVPARTVFVGTPAKKLKDVPADWRSSLLQN